MNKINILESNKMLAEFLCTTQKTEGIDDCYIYGGIAYHIDDLNFHKDWNWLMEVVEKIESLGYISNQDSRICEGSLKPIYYFRIFIKHYRGQNVGYSKSNLRIEAVYNACIEFVKWYNLKSK